jgi:hypothetical protein
MRPALLPVLLLATAACRPSSSHQASAPAPAQPAAPAPRPQPTAERSAGPAPVPTLRLDAKQTECVEKWLKGHRLDAYGNPEGTMYAGGTPTFDEATGKSVDRWTLVTKNRPEALQSCAVPLPP